MDNARRKTIKNHEDLFQFEQRAREYADEFLLKINMPSGASATRTMAGDALRVGWLAGYGQCLKDLILVRKAENEVKH